MSRLLRSGPQMGLALVTLCFVLCATTLRAESLTVGFDAANKLFEQGKFAEAAAGYEKLVQSGQVSAPLYFNLGNAWFKAGQIGRAIAAYRQAEEITPRDPDVRANLQFARNQVSGPTLSAGWWSRWLGRLSVNEWTWLAVGAVWLWICLLIALQFRPGLKPALRSYVVALGLAAVLLCGGCASALNLHHFARRAIVITGEATVRQGPLEESTRVFTVHDGAELQVLDQKDDWLQVSTDPKRIGWLRRDQVLLRPAS